MEYGMIDKEFYVGRFLYLTGRLTELEDARFGGRGDTPAISIYAENPKTGKKESRQRISEKHELWSYYYKIAEEREIINKKLDLLKAAWAEDYGGLLDRTASGYKIIPNFDNPFDSSLWEAFRSNDCSTPNPYPVHYKDYIMRSQFEVDVAKVLDSLGVDYKYEVGMIVGGGKRLYPDMAVNFPEYNRCGFVEAMGGLDNMKYASHNTFKLRDYINAGLYPNRDIAIVSADRGYFPSPALIKRSVGIMLSSIACQYVVKKS